jgi:hypothetical protein
MITAETVNGIVRFQANGLPVVSLYCRVDPGASQREVRARVDSLLDQIRPLAKDRDLWSAPTCRLRSCTTPTRCGSYAGKAARSRLTEAR